jgi:hypothetical protein
MYIGNTPFQGLVGGGNILDASIEGVDLSTSAIAARLGYTPVDPGAAVFSATVGISSGNLNFGSTGQKITADFSNGTVANRTAFQTTTTNGATRLTVLPNGTGTISAINLHGASDPTNASVAQFNMVDGTSAQVQSNRFGTGTYLPLTFHTSNTEQVRIDTSGNFKLNGGYMSFGDNGYIRADSAGWLQLQSGTSGTRIMNSSNGAAFLTIDSTGNVGTGASISSKSSAINDQGIATYGSWTSIQENGFYDAGANFLHNAIKTSGVNDTWNYRFNNTATRYKMLNGVHSWLTAAGGFAAGTAISWNQAMTLDTAGNLLVGVTSSSQSTGGCITIAPNKFIHSNGFGRLWMQPGKQIGQASYAGLYGAALTYMARHDGTNWLSTGGGSVSALTMDEGILSFSSQTGFSAADQTINWVTRLKIDTAGNLNLPTGNMQLVSGKSYVKDFPDATEEYIVDAAVRNSWTPWITYTSSGGTANRGFKFGAWDNNGNRNEFLRIWDGSLLIGTTTASTSESKLNTQVTTAGTFLTLAEFRNLDYTSGTRSFIRVRSQVSSGSSVSAYFGQGQDNKLYIIANNSARGGDIVVDGNNGTVTIPAGIQAKAPTYELYGSTYNEAGLTASSRIRLGTFYTAQGGMDTTIKLAVGAGYNAVDAQVFEYTLRLRTSNGSSSTAGSTGVIYINGFCERTTVDNFGGSNPVESFLVEEVNTGQYNVYIDTSSLIGNYSHYIVETPTTATWVHNPAVLNISAITGNYLTISTWSTTVLTGTDGVIANTRGIAFPATQSASSDANTLDDYEEGTFTTAYLRGNNNAGTFTPSYNTGRYTKVGRLVTYQLIIGGSLSGATGYLLVAGLPFTVNGASQSSTINEYRYLDTTGYTQLGLEHVNESDFCYFYLSGGGSQSEAPVAVSKMHPSAAIFWISGSYYTGS